MTGSMLVAGVGNIFCGDDGFGVEVARRLSGEAMPDGVQVADFGIRGVHLAYELMDGYDELILIDAVPHGQQPGTVYVIEPDLDVPAADPEPGESPMDAHGMDPATVFTTLRRLGGRLDRALVVGCEPADVATGIGLSPPVEQAVDQAVRTVRELVTDMRRAAGVAALGDDGEEGNR